MKAKTINAPLPPPHVQIKTNLPRSTVRRLRCVFTAALAAHFRQLLRGLPIKRGAKRDLMDDIICRIDPKQMIGSFDIQTGCITMEDFCK